MKSSLLYAFYQMEELRKPFFGVTLILAVFVGVLVETSESYQCLMGFSVQIPCILTLVTAQRHLKQHQEGWKKYVQILPISRKKIILSEFILFGFMALISCCMMLLLVLSSSMKGYLVTVNDFGIILGLTVFVSMNSQLFLFLFSNRWKDRHTEWCLVASIFTTCLLLSVPYFLNKEYFFTQYHNNQFFGFEIFAIFLCTTGGISVIAYHIGYILQEKMEY